MKRKYPKRMTYSQWRRTPFRTKHRLVGLALNDQFGYWRTCADARCRRARTCQDYECYWRRLKELPFDEMMRVREAAAAIEKLLWIGCTLGSEGRPLY